MAVSPLTTKSLAAFLIGRLAACPAQFQLEHDSIGHPPIRYLFVPF